MAVVVSAAEWVLVSAAEWAAVSTAAALSAQDSVVGSAGSTVDFAASAAASVLGTALSSASDLITGVTGLITVHDGDILIIPAIRSTVTLTLAIRTRPRIPLTALRPRLRVVIYQSQPPVTVFEAPARPEIREYPETSSPQRDPETSSRQRNEKPIYLIAFKGQSNIRGAQAYWVTENTLHFVTLQGEPKQAPINSIDRDLTFRLNRDRHVDFRLPAEQ